jgi:DNA-binding Xre family transcriptional regulator
MSNTLLRIKQYIDYKKISLRSFEVSIEISNGSFTSQLKNGKTIGVDKLEKFCKNTMI